MVSKALVVGTYQRKLEELARQPGVELTAIVPRAWRGQTSSVQLERAHTTGYDLLVAPLAFNGLYHFHFYPTLGRLLRSLRPDVLHMDEEPYNLATWHALRLGRATGAKGLFFTWQNLQRGYPWPFSAFERANYHSAAYAIAGNQAAVGVLRAKGYAGRVAVIPQFGVDPDIFSPESEPGPSAHPSQARPPGAPRPSYVVGYAGRLVPEKGVDVLIRACAGLPGRDWSLEIVGDGTEQPRLSALAETLDISQQVRFTGQQPSSMLPSIYHSWDVLVLPSVSRPNWVEQFGRVLIEAMACGLPVIGSSCGEIPNVIGDAGLIYPEADVAALRDGLAGLAADPVRRADLAARGRARVLAHFTQAQVALATFRVYQEMVSPQFAYSQISC